MNRVFVPVITVDAAGALSVVAELVVKVVVVKAEQERIDIFLFYCCSIFMNVLLL